MGQGPSLFSSAFAPLGWEIHYVVPRERFHADLTRYKNRVTASAVVVTWIALWAVLFSFQRITGRAGASVASERRAERAAGARDGGGDRPSAQSHGGAVAPTGGGQGGALAQVSERLNSLVARDPLSGAYNRRQLMELLEQEHSKARRQGIALSCLMVDIDHLESINRRAGRAGGDRVLIWVAEHLRRTTRDYDILARYGGEEFVVLLPFTGVTEACTVAGRIIEGVRGDALELEGERVAVTVSIGVARLDLELEDPPGALLEAAAAALLRAKQEGCDRYELAPLEA